MDYDLRKTDLVLNELKRNVLQYFRFSELLILKTYICASSLRTLSPKHQENSKVLKRIVVSSLHSKHSITFFLRVIKSLFCSFRYFQTKMQLFPRILCSSMHCLTDFIFVQVAAFSPLGFTICLSTSFHAWI